MTAFIRKIKDTGELIAFIPSAPANKGMIMSYMHIGQHSEASIDFWLHDTEQCTDDEVYDLRQELKRIGYTVTQEKR